MPRLQVNPNLIECPDFASDIFAPSRAAFVNEHVTEEQAVLLLQATWRVGNDADKLKEVEAHQAAALELDREASRKDEMKRNKAKYIPIPDRGVPDEAPVIASQYAMKRLEKGSYVGMWHCTNAGINDALRNSSVADDDAMVMQHGADGKGSWVPAASARVALTFIEDKELKWEDFCQAVSRMITVMEDAGWMPEHVEMFVLFWGALQVHEYGSSRDPIDQKALLEYQGSQWKLWHQAIVSPCGGYNLSVINEVVLRKTRESVYWDAR
ncbi:hypothetical protein JAAARDRAFT_195407 [Jaapia argillacea MUCL 33604]|uniref:Uncharacterized protein n=1 Tax=Jaapia argillacea MUCL 33604 TaxID=933084 RepID=A0A067PKY1_9AGAM|nr:hypothetical protein JAAARDRAFT_195407 [Jaapia argillacea MUCL 33604]